jgi:hypothetical protein
MIVEELTLTLLMPRLHANHAQYTLALDDFAIAAQLLDRCEYFHDALCFCSLKSITAL